MYENFFLIIPFALGTVVGSFLNVLILRGSRGEKPTGRSRCDSCKKTLAPAELIPIVSFLIQKGRCRSCGAALSRQYPIVELLTGIAYAGATAYGTPSLAYDLRSLGTLAASFLGIAAAIVILVSDIRFFIIPDGAVAILALVGAYAGVSRWLNPEQADFSFLKTAGADLGAASVFFLFFAALWFFSKGRWMGFGDAKLSFAASLLVGYPASIPAFLFSIWLGGLVGAAALAANPKNRGRLIPFGPFILAGAAAAFFFSKALLNIIPLPL